MANLAPQLLILRRTVGIALVSAATIAGASCMVGDSDESVAPPAPVEASAARAPVETAATRALKSAFPQHADRVLGRLGGDGFVANEPGFARPASDTKLSHLDVQLPKDAAGVMKLTAPGGFEFRVREIGAEGEAILADRAVTYSRAGGTSFWTVAESGAEEWLHLAAGTVASDEEVAAAWEVEGATLVAMNNAVALMDDDGIARGWVTAPEAYGQDGRLVDVRLGVQGNRIELYADARGEEVLIDPGWLAVAPIATARYGGALTVLANGKVLLAAGYTGAALPVNAELYDPAANTWSAAGNMTAGRFFPGGALLSTGKVIVLGGQTFAGYVATTELYNPATNTWAAGATMTAGRGLANATVLGSGNVLTAGGYNGVSFLSSAEQYNPVTNTWAAAGTMATARAFGVYVLLQSGKVLVAGGENGVSATPTALAVAELYDPATNTWSSAGTMPAARYAAGAALLANGKVLVVGGANTAGDAITNVDLYDPATNTWSAAAPLPASRAAESVVLLGNGKVLAAGGLTGTAATLTVTQTSVVYDPAANTWTSAGNMATVRYYANSVALPGGDALVVGGSNGAGVVANADRYIAASQASGTACGTALQCASGFCVDGVCCQVAACAASDQCHTAGTCQAGIGVCSNPAKANGTTCDDNSICTQADTCQAGICTGQNPIVCSAVDQCHDAGICNPNTGVCSQPAKMDGTTCDDGNGCTQTDSCQLGVCIGASPVVCMAMDQCHVAGTCDVATGMCDNPNKADGAACDDGSACTQTDTCTMGACTGGNPVMCAAMDQCHDVGTCDAATGMCDNPTKADGAACDDGSACTQTDTCTAGACTGGDPVVCAAMDQCHDAGTCDAATGMCDSPSKPDGDKCDDGDACTQADTCTAGACTGADPVICAASDECHDAGKCDADTGTCDDPNKADGTECSKGTCEAGVCVDSGTGGAGGGGTGGSGGSTGGTSTGGATTGGTDTGGTGGTVDAGGCGCRVAGSDSDDTTPPPAAFVGLALAALAWERRRRAARA